MLMSCVCSCEILVSKRCQQASRTVEQGTSYREENSWRRSASEFSSSMEEVSMPDSPPKIAGHALPQFAGCNLRQYAFQNSWPAPVSGCAKICCCQRAKSPY